MPESKLLILGMVIPPFNRQPLYWVYKPLLLANYRVDGFDDHPHCMETWEFRPQTHLQKKGAKKHHSPTSQLARNPAITTTWKFNKFPVNNGISTSSNLNWWLASGCLVSPSTIQYHRAFVCSTKSLFEPCASEVGKNPKYRKSLCFVGILCWNIMWFFSFVWMFSFVYSLTMGIFWLGEMNIYHISIVWEGFRWVDAKDRFLKLEKLEKSGRCNFTSKFVWCLFSSHDPEEKHPWSLTAFPNGQDWNRKCTPLKTNMSPEPQWLEDGFPIAKVPFQGTCEPRKKLSYFPI